MDLVFAPSQIENWPIDRLRPYARNAKIHGDDQVAKIASSIAKFGWTVPYMVADDGELIAGHGRVLAANILGLLDCSTASVPQNLRGLIGGKVREDLIRQNWPDILRAVATMAFGSIPPSQLLKKLAS